MIVASRHVLRPGRGRVLEPSAIVTRSSFRPQICPIQGQKLLLVGARQPQLATRNHRGQVGTCRPWTGDRPVAPSVAVHRAGPLQVDLPRARHLVAPGDQGEAVPRPYTTCLAEHCNAKWPLTRDELRFLFFLGECADRVASQCATCRVGVVRQLSCSEAARRVELDLEVEPVRGLERDVEALCSCRSASGSDSRRP